MDRRTFLAVLGVGGVALAVSIALPGCAVRAFAKDSGGGDTQGSSGGSPTVKSSTTDQPGTEAQPQAATQCAAGTDCKKK